MAGFTIAQITREFHVTEIEHTSGSDYNVAILKVFTTVNLVDHPLEVDRFSGCSNVHEVGTMAGDTIVGIVPDTTVQRQVGVAILTLGVIDHLAPGNDFIIGYSKCKDGVFRRVAHVCYSVV